MKKTILQYLQEKGIPVNAVCGGNHQCGKCLVKAERSLSLREEERLLRCGPKRSRKAEKICEKAERRLPFSKRKDDPDCSESS